jgi:hypothetical protein
MHRAALPERPPATMHRGSLTLTPSGRVRQVIVLHRLMCITVHMLRTAPYRDTTDGQWGKASD